MSETAGKAAITPSPSHSASSSQPTTTLPFMGKKLMNQTRNETDLPFQCYRCSKRFVSSYALGGHQNAHKKERMEEHRLYVQQRLAKKQQQQQLPPPLPPPPTVVVNSPMVHPLQLQQGYLVVHPLPSGGFVLNGPQGQFFVPAAAAFGYGGGGGGPTMAPTTTANGSYAAGAFANGEEEEEEELDLTLRL